MDDDKIDTVNETGNSGAETLAAESSVVESTETDANDASEAASEGEAAADSVVQRPGGNENASVNKEQDAPEDRSDASPDDGKQNASSDTAEQDAPEEGDQDAYLEYLNTEYRKWRNWALILAIIGFSIILISIGLSQANVIHLKVFNLMMSIANLFIVLMAIIIFTRTRPFKKKIRSYDKYYVSIIDPDAKDGVRIEQRELPDMDDFFKIFERRARTELIPDTAEYKSLRKTWISLYVAAAVVGIAAIVLYLAVPSLSVVATLGLLAAFILVVVAFYFDRTRMRPLRTKWARDNYGMSEFQVRDRMSEEE